MSWQHKIRSYGAARLARTLGLTPQAVSHWLCHGCVPATRVRQVAAVTGIPLHEIRPDLWESPAPKRRAA